MQYDCIIIGGGASGLCTALQSKTVNNSVLILEHSDRVGKKILSTGNGKCNLTNDYCKIASFKDNPEGIYPYFTDGDLSFAESVIGRFDADDTVRFFRELGMLCKNRNGYIYPAGEQASAVLDILRFSCEQAGVDIVTGYECRDIRCQEGVFHIGSDYTCRRLVLATGGKSAPGTGSDGSGYKLAESFGHSIVPPIPALCAVRCREDFFRELTGVRCDSFLTLYYKEGNILRAGGNLQFAADGISGIPVFQISSVIGRELAENRKIYIDIDLFPEMSEPELTAFLAEHSDGHLFGIVNKKVAHVLEKLLQKKVPEKGSKKYAAALAALMKHFRVTPCATAGFAHAQTTAGGVRTSEIDPQTMESKIQKGLYFTGEIMDVNGICGGYNLQWAWSTASICAQAIRKEYD